MINTDSHTHSHFSSDSNASVESMLERAIDLGLTRLCITDHQDLYYPHPYHGTFVFDAEEQWQELDRLRDKYSSRIQLLIGSEFGLRNEPDIKEKVHADFQQLVNKYSYDYIIGSTHVLEHFDPYLHKFWDNRSTMEGLSMYFRSIAENTLYYPMFDSYGHADYIIRYIADPTKDYNPFDYSDLIDEFLKTLIQQSKALECNSSGLKYGLGFQHPKAEILRRYRELGGEMITVGSDAHEPKHVAHEFKFIEELLLSLGFRYYTVFVGRRPVFEPLG